jgi:ATP-dependent Lon protease
MGGATLYIENSIQIKKGDPSLSTTGQMGDVMKESTQIAYTYSKNYLKKIDSSNNFFMENSIHMHIPEGFYSKINY